MCYNLQLMRLIGEEGVAVYGILMYIGFVYASVFIGFNLAIAPVISYNYGAQNHEELKRLLRKSLILLFVAGSILTLLSEVLSGPMAGIFVSYDPQLRSLTAHAIRLYMLSFMICGLNMFVSAFFTALNNGIVSAIAAFARTMIFELGSIFILPLAFGLDGVWLAVDVADVLALIMSVILLAAFRSRYHY
jgi:Na+-driven multidrug efflux pump